MIVGMLSSFALAPSYADETSDDDEKTDVVIDTEDAEPEEGDDEDAEAGGTEAPDPDAPETEDPAAPETEDPDEGEEPEENKKVLVIEEAIAAYLTTEFKSREEKLETMTLKLTRGDYQMYVDPATGEVAVKNTVTGQIILSNPYDIALIQSDNVKSELLSQVIVTFKDMTNNNQQRTMYSYTDAAQRGQIKVKNIKNGIRVEYTIGKQSAKKLMPYWMEASRFETMILAPMAEQASQFEYRQFTSNYTLQDPNTETLETVLQSMYQNYPCTSKSYYTEAKSYTIINKLYEEELREYNPGDNMAIYVIDPAAAASERESNVLESYVKQYCPEYNYEELDTDIELTGYTGDESAAAIFTLALEWYLDSDGFRCEVPLNSLTYDEDTYQLDYVIVNQYLGCTSVRYDGYAFFPDGSGAIITNENIKAGGAAYSVAAEVYGPDFAYHNLFYNGKSEVIYAPVYGIIDGTEYIIKGDLIEADALLFEPAIDEDGKIIRNKDGSVEYAVDENGDLIPIYITVTEDMVTAITEEPAEEGGEPVIVGYCLTDDPDQMVEFDSANNIYYLIDEEGNRVQQRGDIYEEFVNVVNQGFFAIIDGGESLARVTYSYGGISHSYCSIYTSLRPISTDSYNLQEAISVGQNQEWTVTSERKFTGRYTVKYYLISDFEESKYEGTYMGMAKAYRDYLVENGILSLIDDAKADIPLYIESFGSIETRSTFLTIPIWVDTPLTTFEDVKTMYATLKNNEDYSITNVNFRLTGFGNGGMDYEYYPTKVDFEKVLGGDDGYEDLISDAKANGYGVFPSYDFANAHSTRAFDGFKYKWVIKSIDDRYASKREYDATFQSFQRIGAICVSPAYFSKVFDLFTKSFDNYSFSGISAGTLGSDLNSDFDKDEPYNREDNKEYTVEMLKKLYEKYGNNIMVDGGNAYSWQYVRHILNMSLDSSRYLRASASVPFLGIVLHGYVNFSGTPTNMKGDISYEILKIIENGASPYFTLSYQNTQELKEFFYEYFSVDFGIWFKDESEDYYDLIDVYRILNEALKDVQTSVIDDHKFIAGDRVLTDSEKVFLEEELKKAQENYDKEYAAAELKYNNAIERAKRLAEEAGKEFDLEKYVEENGEFEFMEFEEYYESPIDTVIDDYTIVYVRYGNGISFILNYNSFAVTVEINGTVHTIDSMNFVKISA